MADAAVEELSAMGWSLASVDEAYTILQGPVQGQDTLICLVSAGEDTVKVAVPLAARDFLPPEAEQEWAYPEVEVRLAQVRNRGRPTTRKVRVFFVDLSLDAVLEYPEAALEKKMDGCLVFGAADARLLPFAYDLVPGDGEPIEDEAAGAALAEGAAVSPDWSVVGQGREGGVVADLLGAVEKLVERVQHLEHGGGPQPVVAPPRPGTPFLDGMGRGLPGARHVGGAAVAAVAGQRPAAAPAAGQQRLAAAVAEAPAAEPAAGLAAALAALLHQPQNHGYEMEAAPAASEEELRRLGLGGDAPRLGAAQLERLLLTRREQPALVIKAHEEEIRRDLGVLSSEPWGYERHARELSIPAAEGAADLRKILAIIARAIDHHRAADPLQAHAFLLQA